MEIPIGLNLPDQEVVDPLGQHLENVMVHSFGVRPRPGCFGYLSLGTSVGVDGLFWWGEQSLLIAVSGGKVFKISGGTIDGDFFLLEDATFFLLEDGGKLLLESPAVSTEVTGGTAMNTNQRVTFANYGEILFMANGGKVQELHPSASVVTNGGLSYTCKLNHTASAASEPGTGVDQATYWTQTGSGSVAWVTGTRYGSGKADVLEDTSWPITVSFVAVEDFYLFALENGTEVVFFSDVAQPWSCSGDYFAAGGYPDSATCMTSREGSVYVGGLRSVEEWVNDGITPWSPSNYGAIEHGVLAPHSLITARHNGGLYYIDEDRRFVMLQGRDVVSVSESLDTFIKQIPTVADCIADYWVYEGVPVILLQFPTSQQSICLSLLTGVWSEWHSLATVQERWIGRCVANVPPWNQAFIGTNDGHIELVAATYEDDNGSAVTSKIRSPRMQTGGRVISPKLTLHFTKVISPYASGTSSMTVRWRDDGKDWVTARTVTLTGGSDKTDFVKDLHRCGSYLRYRQYEFDTSNLHPYALSKVEQV